MISVVCSVIVEKDSKYLFVKEVKTEASGKFGLPGGRLEPGETLEAAARRELLEEAGYIVESLELITVNQKPKTKHGNTVIKFVYQGIGPQKSAEAVAELELVWLSPGEVETYTKQGLIRGQDVLPIIKGKDRGVGLTVKTY